MNVPGTRDYVTTAVSTPQGVINAFVLQIKSNTLMDCCACRQRDIRMRIELESCVNQNTKGRGIQHRR